MIKSLLKTIVCLAAVLACSSAAAVHAESREYGKASRMYAEGKYTEALSAYRHVLSAQTGKAGIGKVHARIGDCYFQLHDYSNALDAYRIALQNQSPSAQAPTQYSIGLCSFLLGKDKEAVAEFLKIPERYPSSAIWIGTAYYWAGKASERMGDKTKAAEYYRKAGGRGSSTHERFAIKKAEEVSGRSAKTQLPNSK